MVSIIPYTVLESIQQILSSTELCVLVSVNTERKKTMARDTVSNILLRDLLVKEARDRPRIRAEVSQEKLDDCFGEAIALPQRDERENPELEAWKSMTLDFFDLSLSMDEYLLKYDRWVKK